MFSLIATRAAGRPAVAGLPPLGNLPLRDLIIDVSKEFDANEMAMFVTNQGSWAFNKIESDAGLEWPQGSDKFVIFAGGLWLGARVNGQVRVTVGEFSQEYAAGPIGADGMPIDPWETDPAHHVYKINAGDGPSNPDYANWPAHQGAPVNPDGTPRVIGEQTLWCAYNDAVPGKHTNSAGNSLPLGVEVRQTAFGFDRPGALGKTVFLDFEIENKGNNVLEDMYMAFWYDPDLGGFTDDLLGCDTTLSLGYCYNATDEDLQYEAHPPTVGCKLLLGPVANGNPLGMTAFNKYINGTDPQTPIETYNYMQGLELDGNPQLCDGEPTRFILSGDPVAGTGCLDSNPADRRMMMTTGPVTMNPGDTQHVVIAVIVGGEFGEGDRLSNVTLLKSYCRAAQDAFDRGFQDLNDFPDCDAGGPYVGNAGDPVFFDGTASFDPDGAIVAYHWDFGDGAMGEGPLPSHTYAAGGLYQVTLTVTDDRGAQSSCGTSAELPVPGIADFVDVTPAGVQRVEHINVGPNSRALTGVDWGGRYFFGGADTGCRWSGSTITDAPEDLSECPGAAVEPGRFKSVELRFGPAAAGKGYLYYRRELADGSPPPLGRQYAYAGFVDIPFVANDSLTNQQLVVMVTERQVVDGNNVPLPPDQQPPTYDGTWGPSDDSLGGREYINVLDVPYAATPDPQFAQDGLFFSGTIPVLYGFWLRLRDPFFQIDPGDKIVVRWVPVRFPGDGADVAWVDHDRDGDLDLHVASSSGIDRLFRNDGGGEVFADATRGPIGDPGQATAAGWADFDNDQDLDLYLAHASGENRLLRSDGNDVFAEVTSEPLAAAGAAAAAAWADYDLDADLDLFLANTGGTNKLFRNDGNNVFTNVTPGPLGGTPGSGRGASWGDFDRDLDPDLYLANAGPDQLFRNDGGGTFSEVTAGPLADPLAGADADWGDYDNDGDLDLYVVNADGPNRLLRNDGGGEFSDATAGPLGDQGVGRAAAWLDLDHDADLDLHVVNADGPDRVLRNEGNGVFASAMIPPLEDAGPALDAAWGDYDQDGDLDLYLANEGEAKLLRNELRFTRWLHVDLVGLISNATGVGARVRVAAGGISQVREVSGNSGNSLTVEFGLGTATSIDFVEVRWPSGIVQTVLAPAINQRIEVVEDESSAVELASLEAASEVGGIVLTWVTSHEANHLGFHVWRAPEDPERAEGGPGGGYERLTPEILREQNPYRFVDEKVEEGRAYAYRIEAVSVLGDSQFFGPVHAQPLPRPAPIPDIPQSLALYSNVPNPFNPATEIRFDLPAAAEVELTIYDITGRLVRRLVEGRLEPGIHRLPWDGRNDDRQAVGSGVYFYRLEVGVWSRARKMAVIR